ncbi:hypothetical protein F4780DRAFT_700123 [Xylariomycetidae sp. FL0641]|nr:hypothetical protein F4780DRAFT_700123 [Xylariomycetidae sp. FL0641]
MGLKVPGPARSGRSSWGRRPRRVVRVSGRPTRDPGVEGTRAGVAHRQQPRMLFLVSCRCLLRRWGRFVGPGDSGIVRGGALKASIPPQSPRTEEDAAGPSVPARRSGRQAGRRRSHDRCAFGQRRSLPRVSQDPGRSALARSPPAGSWTASQSGGSPKHHRSPGSLVSAGERSRQTVHEVMRLAGLVEAWAPRDSQGTDGPPARWSGRHREEGRRAPQA